MSGALSELDRYIAMFPGKQIWITECSDNGPPHPGNKGADYVAFHAQVKLRPSVKGLYYFVSSAAPETFDDEVWVKNGTSLGIAEIVGQR